MDIEVLEKFNIQVINPTENSFGKIRVDKSNMHDLLSFLKNTPEYSFDRLNSIIAIDLGVEANLFELIYDLHSIEIGKMGRISVLIDRNSPILTSVVDIFKSAYFDECEIFDLFGINFDKNPSLKRLMMPTGWQGYPLRKDYVQSDERLAWND